MNDLCAEIGCRSINHYGEQLCGDHVDIVERDENYTVLVLADGMGSGVKASILSTLTSIAHLFRQGSGLFHLHHHASGEQSGDGADPV